MRNRMFFLTAIAGLFVAVFSSCIDDPEPAPLDAITDVYIRKTIEEGVEQYSLGFWVMANKNMDSVVVEGPDESTWELTPESQNDKRVFRLKNEDITYIDTIPAIGDYSFKIKSTQEGEDPITVKDKLTNKILGTLEIDSVKFTNSGADVHWKTVANADHYITRLYDEDDKMIYGGPNQLGTKTAYTIASNDNYWAQGFSPKEGDTYRLELLAILYEEGVQSSQEPYNVQAISIAKMDIEWE